jgi:hypothetical protein
MVWLKVREIPVAVVVAATERVTLVPEGTVAIVAPPGIPDPITPIPGANVAVLGIPSTVVVV